MLDALAEHADRTRYLYTDLGPALLQLARGQFAGRRGLEFSTYDIEGSPEEQGFEPQSMDVVLASNVLHTHPPDRAHTGAVPATAQTRRHPGRERADPSPRLQHLTFGLTPGWWLCADTDPRIEGSPLISGAGWDRSLREAGFADLEVHGIPGAAVDEQAQCLIVATAAGAGSQWVAATGDSWPGDGKLRQDMGMIEVDHLSYGYRADGDAIRGITCTVEPGEIFGFLGPSGAGKSTTQKVLIGLLKPYTGQVRVLGRELRDQGAEYYQHIGVGFELPNHFVKLTALENLRFFASFYAATTDPRELLARVGLSDAANQRVEQFSKGMKMRLSFVRALLHDPQVLFLDEPTSGLDPVNARLLKDIIMEQREHGKSIFLTTHNMVDADELCDQVAFIVDGEIRRIGIPRELRAEGGRRAIVVQYRQDGELRSAEFRFDGLGRQPDFLDLVRDRDRDLVTIHSQEATLEDVFVQTTGRRLT